MGDTPDDRFLRIENHLRGFGLTVLTPEEAEEQAKEQEEIAKAAEKAERDAELEAQKAEKEAEQEQKELTKAGAKQ
jgi:hypothetical protein